MWDKWTNEQWRLVVRIKRRGWKMGREVDNKAINSKLCTWLGSAWKNS